MCKVMSFTGPEGGLLTNNTPEPVPVKMRKRGKVQNGTVLLEKITAQVHVDSENTASESPTPPMPDMSGGGGENNLFLQNLYQCLM
jgi:hypothetical protein